MDMNGHQFSGMHVTVAVLALHLLLLLLTTDAATAALPVGIPLSSTVDCTPEGSSRSGNALLLQDIHRWVELGPGVFSTSHPAGLDQLEVNFWYLHLLPLEWTQICRYDLPPDESETSSTVFAVFAYGNLLADLGDTNDISAEVRYIFDTRWHHISVSWMNSGSADMKFYIDGQLARTVSNVESGYRLPAGGIFSIDQERYAKSAFGAIDQFIFFTQVLSDADRTAVLGSSAWAPSNSALLGGVLSRGHAEWWWSFDQPLHRPTDTSEEIIVDESGNGNHGRIICTTHCLPAMVVPSAAPTFSSDSLTRLFPVVAAPSDYVLQLAHSTSDPATLYSGNHITITSLPDGTLATLYRVIAGGAAGAALSAGDVVQAAEMPPPIAADNVIAILLRLSSNFDFSSSTSLSFDIAVSTSSVPLSTMLTLGPNHLPSVRPPLGYLVPSTVPVAQLAPSAPFVRIDVNELSTLSFDTLYHRYPTNEFYSADADNDHVQVYLTSIPTFGSLFQNETERSAGRSIQEASLQQPVLITDLQLLYEAPSYSSLLPLSHHPSVYPDLGNIGLAAMPNASFVLSDGMQTASEVSFIIFNIVPVAHLPIMLSMNKSISVQQESMTLLQLPIDSSNLDNNDRAYVVITSLPNEGVLYQYEADGSVGGAFGLCSGKCIDCVGSGDIPACNSAAGRTFIAQYLSEVLAVSSSYPDSLGRWNATQILGPPNAYPDYGDSEYAWAGDKANSAEWIEVAFPQPVYITGIEIYEVSRQHTQT
jgi:hypothetical protein